ncbi:GM25903 [Drosophila sechellia]|uniref:GM25903 n=1 Tax=Drosophila sechellia TaxID=7238 RepID=B4HF84_DROSE|nr:GM25903 [Drosophila sechellia]
MDGGNSKSNCECNSNIQDDNDTDQQARRRGCVAYSIVDSGVGEGGCQVNAFYMMPTRQDRSGQSAVRQS